MRRKGRPFHRGSDPRREVRRERAPEAKRAPTALDRAWAAGFLEGEGCFVQRKWTRQVSVIGVQVNPEPLLRLQEVFGGSVHLNSRPKGNQQQAYRWVVHGERARRVMVAVYAFMSATRRTQIQRAYGGIPNLAHGCQTELF